MNKQFFQNNRVKYAKLVSEKSISIFYSGNAPQRSGDQPYLYEANRNFYYLCGIKQANVILMIVKGTERFNSLLYIEENDLAMAKWYGNKLSLEEASEISGVDKVKYLKDFDKDLFSLININRTNGAGYIDMYLDLERQNMVDYTNWALEYSKKVRNDYPEVLIHNAYDKVVALRTVKEKEEIDLIKQSIETTKGGILSLMEHSKVGLYEYQLESYFDQYIKFHGQKTTSFKTIAACGINGTILHYVNNDTIIKDNELVLFDLGCCTDYYISDITRTFPANGKFTDRQKEVYTSVLNVNKKSIEFLKAGITWKEYQDYARNLIFEECKKLGLVKDFNEVFNYYWHGIGHSIGLDTHDPTLFDLPLQEGVTLTVEPGIYIEEEKIGIRIEDNVVITKDGCINLSKDIIKEIDDIEAFMKNRSN